MAICALRVLSRTVFLGLISCLGVGAAFAQTPVDLPQDSAESQQERAVYKAEVSGDFPGVFPYVNNIPFGASASYRVNEHLKVFYRFAYHDELYGFMYVKSDGVSRKSASGEIVTRVFTHGPGLRLFPAAGGTFNLSSGIDFAFSKGKVDQQATGSDEESGSRHDPLTIETHLNEARFQVFIGNAWELGRFRLACDWFGLEKQFLVFAENSSLEKNSTWGAAGSKTRIDGLSDSRKSFRPVFFRLSTGMAF